MNLELLQFQAKYAGEIIEQTLKKTLWSPNDKENTEKMYALAKLDRVPFGSQVENGILPILKSLEEYKNVLLNADMGTGKTIMSFSTAYLYLKDKPAKERKILFLTSGGKHIPKMIDEAKAVFGDMADVYTIVNKRPDEKITKKQLRVEDVYAMVPEKGRFLVFILSKDTAKITLGVELAFTWGDNCPSCHNKILPKGWKAKVKKFPAKWWKEADKYYSKIKNNPYNCPNPSCNASLETVFSKNLEQGKGIFSTKKNKKKGTRKISVGEKFRRISKQNKREQLFGMLIVDEVHEMQNAVSLQSQAYRDLVKVSSTTLIMTGTLSNGYPSSIFYILHTIMPRYFKSMGYEFNDVGKFVDHYGARKSTKSKDIIKTVGSKTTTKIQELPRISDRIVSLLAPFTAWLKMSDLNLKMPAYSEESVIMELDPDVGERLGKFRDETLALLKAHNPTLVKSFAQRFMYLQNNPAFPFRYEFEGEVVTKSDIEGADPIITKENFMQEFQPFEADRTFSKEEVLVNRIKKELSEDRKVLLYSIYNTAALIGPRLEELLKRELGEDVVIKFMPDHVGSERILPWIAANPCDVLIASPLKLATGIDLVQFPTIIFYESGINLRTAQQAARRSWRAVGQSKPVKVVFMAYNGIQASILEIMAKKMKSAAVIEGSKVQGQQLASIFDDDPDFTAALNDIENELAKEYKPDFSSSKVEEGKLRPATVMEVEYDRIIAEVKGTVLEEQPLFDEDEALAVESKTVEAKFEEEEIDLEPIVGKKEEEISVVKILTKTGRSQLAFEW